MQRASSNLRNVQPRNIQGTLTRLDPLHYYKESLFLLIVSRRRKQGLTARWLYARWLYARWLYAR
jgi:hypothetical protein